MFSFFWVPSSFFFFLARVLKIFSFLNGRTTSLCMGIFLDDVSINFWLKLCNYYHFATMLSLHFSLLLFLIRIPKYPSPSTILKKIPIIKKKIGIQKIILTTEIKLYTPNYYNANDLTLGDFTGDGKIDIVAISGDPSISQVFVLKNTSSLSTISFNSVISYFNPNSAKVTTADFDNDGVLDFATVSEILSASLCLDTVNSVRYPIQLSMVSVLVPLSTCLKAKVFLAAVAVAVATLVTSAPALSSNDLLLLNLSTTLFMALYTVNLDTGFPESVETNTFW